MKKIKKIKIGSKYIGEGEPAYIISEAGSNFDGDIERAKKLAKLSKEAGADAYKIQNFTAPKIVSAEGFADMKVAFQAKWDKPVVEVYRKAEFPREWIKEVADYCREIGIDFFSSPYDTDAVDELGRLNVPAYKIGSGEIDNVEFLKYVAKTGKPIIIGAGAATMKDIELAVNTIRRAGNEHIILLQCVTNYPSPLIHANIKAMVRMREVFGVEVGYSDHTIGKEGGGDDPLWGITVPLGAVALGGRVIEKHFTDDRTRTGPDHSFAMDPHSFSLMVQGVRAIESALGSGKKAIMPSEKETVIIQRRGVYASRDIKKGERLTMQSVEFLRPALSMRPPEIKNIISKKAKKDIAKGKPLYRKDFI